MIFSGTTVLFSLLYKAGEDFWLVLPLLIGVSFSIVYPIAYSFSPRGRIIRRKKKLITVYENERGGTDAVKRLKSEISAEKSLKKDVPRDIGWKTEILFSVVYFLASIGISAISCAVLTVGDANSEKIAFVAFCSLSSTAICGIAIISYLVVMREKTLRAIEYIRRLRYKKYHE